MPCLFCTTSSGPSCSCLQTHDAVSALLLDSTRQIRRGTEKGLVILRQNPMATATGLRKEGKGRAWPRKNHEANIVAFTTTHAPCGPLASPLKAWVFTMLFDSPNTHLVIVLSQSSQCPHIYTHTYIYLDQTLFL